MFELREDGEKGELIETTATLDWARIRAKKLSNDGTWVVIFGIEGGKRTIRSYAGLGKVYWPKTCRDCRGKKKHPDYANLPCSSCGGNGVTADVDGAE